MGTFSAADVDVIFAEDDVVFQTITLPLFGKAGLKEGKVFAARDGSEALERFDRLQNENVSCPILVILDMVMPNMSGLECAEALQERRLNGKAVRTTYIACCAAGLTSTTIHAEGESVFNLSMSKPFGKKELEFCIEKMQRWLARHRDGAPDAPDPNSIEVIIADDEPLCRRSLMTRFGKMGMDEASMKEADTLEGMMELVEQAQEGDLSRPLMLLVGDVSWLQECTSFSCECTLRTPYIVCTRDCNGATPEANATLPQPATKRQISEVLRRCSEWWSDK